MSNGLLHKLFAWLVTSSLMISGAAQAADPGREHRVETGKHQQVQGIDIYYGLLPAQIAGAHPPAHEEQKMHGGAPAGKNEYHLVVALFDAGGKRITDAVVAATVGEFGMSGTRKALEPMRIADATSFGNYFLLRGAGIYRIAIEIKRTGKRPETIEALFDYRLQ